MHLLFLTWAGLGALIAPRLVVHVAIGNRSSDWYGYIGNLVALAGLMAMVRETSFSMVVFICGVSGILLKLARDIAFLPRFNAQREPHGTSCKSEGAVLSGTRVR